MSRIRKQAEAFPDYAEQEDNRAHREDMRNFPEIFDPTHPRYLENNPGEEDLVEQYRKRYPKRWRKWRS